MNENMNKMLCKKRKTTQHSKILAIMKCTIIALLFGTSQSFALNSSSHLENFSLTKKKSKISNLQDNRNVKGIVVDAMGESIIGVNVVVKGTTNGTITDLDGYFSLDVPSNGILVFSYMGYTSQEIPVNGKTTFDVILKENTEILGEVVVTALGIKRDKKALGYSTQEIKTSSFVENHSESVANMLQGKLAGVQISQSGTGIGGSTRIILRGTTSLSGNNEPLWVVDGMPISDNSAGQASQWGGADYSGAASQINPENIESISVLKGANAAALYGSKAQNGAIIVTTKKGKSGKLKIEYNGSLTYSNVYNPYKYQNTYGQGSNGEFSSTATGSWGAKMDGAMIPNWRSEVYGDDSYKKYAYSPQKDYIKDFYRTGSSYTNTLIASGGTENLTSRFSFSDSRNEDVTPNYSLNRQYYDLNTNFTSEYIDVSAKVDFMRQIGTNRPTQGEYGVMKTFVTMPRSIRLQDIRNPVGQDGYLVNWSGPSTEYRNPYSLTMPQNGNKDVRNRLIGNIQMVGKITSYLKLTGRVGLDWYTDQKKSYTRYMQKTNNLTGSYAQARYTTEEFNADLILNFDKRFGDFSVLANAGAATNKFKTNALYGASGTLMIPDLLTLANGKQQTVSENFSQKRINSVLGNASVGYKSMVYLDVTARNDWSSTLPADNRSYFYPSVSLSGIVSEMFDLPEAFSFIKVRGSWAQVGNDTDPYRLRNTYSLGLTNGNILNAISSSVFPLYNLKPEETNSTELGLDMKFLNGCLGADVTYYKSTTKNQILNVPLPSSSGYTSKSINAGKMSSYGWEVMLTATPIETRDFSWDVSLNWGMNRTKCIELDPVLKQFVIGQTRIGKVVVNEGGRYGDIISKAYKRNAQNRVLVSDNGMPVIESNVKIGNMTPDWTSSFSTSLKYRNWRFSALVDASVGGDFISATDMYACTAGTSARTLEGRDGMVVNGIVESTGKENNKFVKAQDYFASIGGAYGVGEEFLCDATYVKMRELSIGYLLPATWLQNLPISNVRFSVVGRDLFYIMKNAPVNPEGSFSRADYAQAFEYASMPPSRSLGFSLSVKF